MSVAEEMGGMSAEDMVDALLDGRDAVVERSGGPLAEKLLKLKRLAPDAEDQMSRWVDMSVAANGGVRAVAEMSTSIREVDSRTQSIAAAVEELSATVQTINATTEAVSSETQDAAAVSDSGRQAATEAVSSMEAVYEVVRTAVEKVDALAEASTQIGDIVSTIESIAKQTNLLALNATIEAARAGEAGKGFAVVANEVKTLANQTATATVDIRARISSIRTDMEEIVTVMRSGAERVEQGRGTIQTVGTEMETLADRISSVTRSMAEVAQILGEQQSATTEISEGVGVIANMSAQNVYRIDAAISTLEETGPAISQSIDSFVQADTPNATIHAAKSDHMIWMRRLAQMLAGRARLNPNELADHHSCRLGKWYDKQTDPALVGHPAWTALLEPHQQVHRSGIEAARAFESGNLEAAIEHVHAAGDASKEVMRLLDELSKQVSR